MKDTTSLGKFDFDHKLEYENRDRVAAGCNYGIGQPPKQGTYRQSYMDGYANASQLKKSPKAIK